MNTRLLKSLLRAKLALAALVAAGAVLAGSFATEVKVKVKLVKSSGACVAVISEPAVQVQCQRPGGPLLPEAGTVPYQRAGTIEATGLVGATEALPVYSDGTKITSWRVVQLDNARYLELTIAW